MSPYRPNRKQRRSKKYKKIMSEDTNKVEEPQLSIGDFAAAIRIIDVASERGAFKGPELSSVGSIRDKYQAFVDFHAPKENEENGSEATTEGEEATEETSE